MARLKLSPPWNEYATELSQMFKYDREVHVVYDDEAYEVKLYVDSAAKATALKTLLPEEKVFGNVKQTITIVPANGFHTPLKPEEVFDAAFKGNAAYSFSKTIHGVFDNDLTYVVFKNRVVQYFNDNLGDIYGQRSTLYQEIAKDLFGEMKGVYFCTDVEEPVKISMPLGEWP